MTKISCNIDLATLADLAELAGMEKSIFDPSVAVKPRQWRYHLSKNPRAIVPVLRGHGQILADALLLRRRDRAGETIRIYSFAVQAALRGKGLGRTLLHECIRAARSRGVRAVTLEVSVTNRPAIRLYESAGFVKTALLRNYYEPGDAWKMWLTF